MNISAWLIAMVGPLTARVLASLGLSLVTVAGLGAAVGALREALFGAIGGLPAATVQLAGLFGIWECLGIGLGAITFVVSWVSMTGAWKLARAA